MRLFFFWCVLVLPISALAQSDDPAPQLMRDSYTRMRQGIVDEKEVMEVHLIGRDGTGAPVKHYERLIQYKDGGDHIRVKITDGDSRNMAVLIHKRMGQSDLRWLYLPAYKRVQPIADSRGSDPALGTDFSHEDLSLQSDDAGGYDYRTLRAEETLTVQEGEGAVAHDVVYHCRVIEARAKAGVVSTYSRREIWLSTDFMVPVQQKYYDAGGRLVKTQVNKVLHEIVVDAAHLRVVRTGETVMTDNLSNHVTRLVFPDAERRFNQSLPDRLWNKEELGR